MMENVRGTMEELLKGYDWALELAGILPLSALIDFIRVPYKLHILQLTGNVPLWSWAVTPSGSRLLLEPDSGPNCYLDCYGNSQSLDCIDGRYGDRYVAANPETLRLCLQAGHCTRLLNEHRNMLEEDSKKRPQWLEVVHVKHNQKRSIYPFFYTFVVVLGWIMMLGGVVASGLLQLYLALGFLLAIMLTGFLVQCIHGGTPRKLLVEEGTGYQRLILSASHMNEIKWYLFVGDSIILNSLLNRALTTDAAHNGGGSTLLRFALRATIGAQWACAIGAAATKDWNAYLITFFIFFCIVSHAYLFPPSAAVRYWLAYTAHLEIQRYVVELSSRRALLNTIVALNPDSFEGQDIADFRKDGLKILDPILNPSAAREAWESATLAAIKEVHNNRRDDAFLSSAEGRKEVLSKDWLEKYHASYWANFIPEGIHVAAIIRQALRATD